MPKLTDVFNLNLQSEGSELLDELPHWDFEGQAFFGRTFNLVDFQIEKYKIDQAEKKKLVHAFVTTGFIGKLGAGWVFFSNGAKGQPEIAEASPQQIESLPHLPDDWESYVREV